MIGQPWENELKFKVSNIIHAYEDKPQLYDSYTISAYPKALTTSAEFYSVLVPLIIYYPKMKG